MYNSLFLGKVFWQKFFLAKVFFGKSCMQLAHSLKALVPLHRGGEAFELWQVPLHVVLRQGAAVQVESTRPTAFESAWFQPLNQSKSEKQ
jgi:hypothetical protein